MTDVVAGPTAGHTHSSGVTGRVPRRVGRATLGLIGLATLMLVGEALPRVGLVSPDYLPPTSRILVALGEELREASFWSALGDTLTAWAIGLTLAATLGIAVGVLLGLTPLLLFATMSTIEFLRPIPSVALIPVAVLLYGSEIRSSLLLVTYAAFWPVLLQVLAGVRDVDPIAAQTARSYRLGWWYRVRYLHWPTALPYIFTGVRLSASVALILAVTTELIIGAPGLGARIAVAQTSNAVPALYALIVVTGLIGVTINQVTRAGERHLLAWHQSVRGEAPR